jgi:hypothetical protein
MFMRGILSLGSAGINVLNLFYRVSVSREFVVILVLGTSSNFLLQKLI